MKSRVALILVSVLTTACSYTDFMVDKTLAKYENETMIIVPANAVKPVVNAEAVNKKITDFIVVTNQK